MTACSVSRASGIVASAALAGCLLAGCGTGSSPTTPTQPAVAVRALEVTPSTTAMTVGETLQLVATATLSDQRKVTTGFEVRWTSADEKVATVDGGGLVTAWRNGNAYITATSAGISRLVSIEIRVGSRRMTGQVTQVAPKEEPVMEARVTVVDGVYAGITSTTDRLGRFALLNVAGVVKLRVSAPYFEDTEVVADAGSPVVVRLAPAAGMIIDSTVGGGAPQGQLPFVQRRTGAAHLTVLASIGDTTGFEAWCSELRDDENRLLWQTSSRENFGYEAKRTLTLTGGKGYVLKVYDCNAKYPNLALGSYALRAEHM